mgnify:FL=1
MELKTKYQYTYFIYPFVIKENKYQKYMLRLIKDQNFELKIFDKHKDEGIYKYFLPKMNNFLFSDFSLNKEKIENLKDLPEDTASAILSKYPCTMFEYTLKRDVQGKTDKNGIFFKIQKIELICFNTGICFLLLKTNIEESDSFADVLNFNYKFRNINNEEGLSSNYEKIYLQGDMFANSSKLTEFIENITGSRFEIMKLDIDKNTFFFYFYVCIDQQAWNEQKSFDDIKFNFVKFANFLSADNVAEYENKDCESFSQWKYARFGFSKQGVTLFTSDANMNNYTILPDLFEKEYLYTYICNLYKKNYLKKIDVELRIEDKVKKARKKFISFNKEIWSQEITEDDVGACLNYEMSKSLELDKLYDEIKDKYDVLYKAYNVEKNNKLAITILIVMILLLIFSILNWVSLGTDSKIPPIKISINCRR